MATKRAGRYRLTHFWASVLVGLGFTVLVIGLLGGGLLILLKDEIPVPAPWSRPLVAAVAVVGGLVLSAPLILAGQLVQIILDQRRLLGRIQRHLQRWEDERESERAHPMRRPERQP